MAISQEKLDQLSAHFEWAGDQFGFILFYGDDSDRKKALETLSPAVAAPEILSPKTGVTPSECFNDLIETLCDNRTNKTAPSWLWVDLTRSDLTQESLFYCFGRLNERRFNIEQLACPVVLQLPKSIKESHLFDYNAPDLYHVRSFSVFC